MPDKADRKRSVVKLSVNEAGLEMIIKRMSESGTDKLGACPCYPRVSSQNGTGGGVLAKIPKWLRMRTRMFGNFRVPPRGSAADLSEIVPGGIACRKVPIRCGLAGHIPMDQRRKAEQA